jgi:hypothetical protein
LDSIEKLLKELVEIARANWQIEQPEPKVSSASAKTSFEKTMRAKEIFEEALKGSAAYVGSAPDMADVYDPKAHFYKRENAEIEGVDVPQKGRPQVVKGAKVKPDQRLKKRENET